VFESGLLNMCCGEGRVDAEPSATRDKSAEGKCMLNGYDTLGIARSRGIFVFVLQGAQCPRNGVLYGKIKGWLSEVVGRIVHHTSDSGRQLLGQGLQQRLVIRIVADIHRQVQQ
jgi:hypothetical protein